MMRALLTGLSGVFNSSLHVSHDGISPNTECVSDVEQSPQGWVHFTPFEFTYVGNTVAEQFGKGCLRQPKRNTTFCNECTQCSFERISATF